MASNIDITQPPTGSATTAGVRNNFSAAKSEIEALQSDVSSHTGQSAIHAPLPAQVTPAELEAGTSTNTRLWSPKDVTDAVALFQSGVDPTPSTSPLWLDGSVAATELTTGDIAVVVAHFDDETLWLLPATYLAKDVVQIMIPFSSAQQEVLEALPAWYQARFRRRGGNTTDSDYINIWADQTARLSLLQREAVRARVRAAVYNTPAANIVTHNPWGEYGHMHHRMVYEEVRAACIAYGKSCWFSDILIPEDAGPTIGGNAADGYVTSGLSNLDYVLGRIIAADLEAIRAVFLANDAINAPPSTWTWSDTFHPASDDGGAGYVDWKYHRIVDAGVADTSDDAAIAVLEAGLEYWGCPSQNCGTYYP